MKTEKRDQNESQPLPVPNRYRYRYSKIPTAERRACRSVTENASRLISVVSAPPTTSLFGGDLKRTAVEAATPFNLRSAQHSREGSVYTGKGDDDDGGKSQGFNS